MDPGEPPPGGIEWPRDMIEFRLGDELGPGGWRGGEHGDELWEDMLLHGILNDFGSEDGSADEAVAPGGVRDGTTSGDATAESTLAAATTAQLDSESDDGEMGDVCRICRCPAEPPARVLYHPCKCSGSIKFVHQDCLLRWLTHSGRQYCEVCKYEFSFTPLYADSAPPMLSLHDLIYGVGDKAVMVARFSFRLVLITFIWLICLPLLTCMTARLAFCRSFGEVASKFGLRLSPLYLISDCVQGGLLSLLIVFCFTIFTSMREGWTDFFGERRPPPRRPRARPPNEQQGDDQVAGVDGAAAGHGQGDRPPAPAAPAVPGIQIDWDRAWAPLDNGFGAEMAIEEVVGLQGPLWPVFENAVLVAIFNVIIVLLGVALPFASGQLVAAGVMQFYSLTGLGAEVADFMKNIAFPEAVVDAAGPIKVEPAGNSSVVMEIVIGLIFDDVQEHMLEPVEAEFAVLCVGWAVLCTAGVIAVIIREIIRIRTEEGRAKWRRRGQHVARMAAEITGGLREAGQFIGQHLVIAIKVLGVILAERALVPLIVGFWLDICSVCIFGGTLTDRVDLLLEHPLSMCGLHWFVGLGYMLYASVLVTSIQDILVPFALPQELAWLRLPADEAQDFLRVLMDEPLANQLLRVLASLVMFTTSMVGMVHLPIQLVKGVFPWVLPFTQSFARPTSEISMDVLLFHVLMPLALEHMHGARTIKLLERMARKWFSYVTCLLDVEHMLQPEDNIPIGDLQPILPLHPHADLVAALAGAIANGPQVAAEPQENLNHGGGDHPDGQPAAAARGWLPSWILALPVDVRSGIAIFASASLLLSIHVAVLVIPVSLGRAFFFLSGQEATGHDVYSVLIGLYVLWAVARCWHPVLRMLAARDILGIGHGVARWIKLMAQAFALFVVVVGICPLLLGVLLELLMLPIRVAPYKSPILFLYQDWVLGLLCLKLWHRAVMIAPIELDDPVGDAILPEFLWPRQMPGHAGRQGWRAAFNELHRANFNQDTLLFAWKAVAVPLVLNLLTALALPYAISRAVLPALGLLPKLSLPLVQLYSYHLLAGSIVLCFVAVQLLHGARRMHEAIRDHRYLVGRQLNNFRPPE